MAGYSRLGGIRNSHGSNGVTCEMKYIRKGRPPHDYATWCRAVRGTTDEDYRNLRGPEKARLRDALLREQGWLCAYTMKRIDQSIAHIEHIKPETLCRTER